VSKPTKYAVHIRNNDTGETRVFYTETVLEPWDGNDVYDWEAGNHSCDCNRGACFARAANPDEWDVDDCGNVKYDVLKIVLDDGTEVPINRWI
jgi:hypothetical protein